MRAASRIAELAEVLSELDDEELISLAGHTRRLGEHDRSNTGSAAMLVSYVSTALGIARLVDPARWTEEERQDFRNAGVAALSHVEWVDGPSIEVEGETVPGGEAWGRVLVAWVDDAVATEQAQADELRPILGSIAEIEPEE